MGFGRLARGATVACVRGEADAGLEAAARYRMGRLGCSSWARSILRPRHGLAARRWAAPARKPRHEGRYTEAMASGAERGWADMPEGLRHFIDHVGGGADQWLSLGMGVQ